METKRTSFLIYLEDEKNYDILTDEELGVLIRSFFRYVKNGTIPKFNERAQTISFNTFKDKYDRDDKKYKEIIKERSKAGKKSAEVRRQARGTSVNKVKRKEQVLTNVKSVKQNLTNLTDKERDKERDKELDYVNEPERDIKRTREGSLSPSQLKFKKAFPHKIIDADLLREQDIDKLIKAVKKSEFLSSASTSNLTLKWFSKNYDDVISGKYDKFANNKNKKDFETRSYTNEEMNELFDNLDEVRI